MVGYAIAVVLFCLLIVLFIAHQSVLADRQWYRDNEEKLGEMIDQQIARARKSEELHASSAMYAEKLSSDVKSLCQKRTALASELAASADKCLRLEKEMSIDREWKADAVIRLAAFELAKYELLENLDRPFRKREPWSDLVARLFRKEEGTKKS